MGMKKNQLKKKKTQVNLGFPSLNTGNENRLTPNKVTWKNLQSPIPNQVNIEGWNQKNNSI